jgi:hypothetical protein
MQFSKNRPNQVANWNGYFGQDSPSEDQIEPFLRKVPPFRVRSRDIHGHKKGQKNNHEKSCFNYCFSDLQSIGCLGSAVHQEPFSGTDPSTGCSTTRRSFTAGAGAPVSRLPEK